MNKIVRRLFRGAMWSLVALAVWVTGFVLYARQQQEYRGYCKKLGRVLTDDELIAAALQEDLYSYLPPTETRDTLITFRQRHPGCCVVYRDVVPGLEQITLRAVLHPRYDEFTVRVRFQMSQDAFTRQELPPDKKYMLGTYHLNPCGGVLRHGGHPTTVDGCCM